MSYRSTQTHHDIKPATPVGLSQSVVVRDVVDFTPQRVKRPTISNRGPNLYHRISRFVLSLSLLLALVSLGPWGHTISFYNDVEESHNNTFTAGLVDFVLADTPFADVASTTDWEVDVTPNDLSNPFYYYASSSEFIGDLDLCAALTVTATLDGEVMYSGLLSELITSTTTVIDTWVFDFDTFEDYAGQSCKFFVDYNGWQTRHGIDQGGYSDTERVMYIITVPSLLLGKVYFTTGQECTGDVVTTTTTTSATCVDTQTWVELYNRTDTPIDVQGWSLCNGDSCFTISDSSQYIDNTIIPAGEYGIVAADPNIHLEISLPWGVLPLVTDGPWFVPDLDPSGDMLQLRDPDDLLIDQLNWGQLDLGWNNFTPDLWPSNSLTATTGHALARIPVGFDSNEPDDWVLLGVPTLTIDSVAPAILQPGATTTITYEAVNTNGLNADLRIDVYLFEPDDTLHLVELDIENSGEYTFTIPADLEGPVRFKIVATGPENPLLNARAVTEPLPFAETTTAPSGGSGGLSSLRANNVSAPVIAAATTTASAADGDLDVFATTTSSSTPEIQTIDELATTTVEVVVETDTTSTTEPVPDEEPVIEQAEVAAEEVVSEEEQEEIEEPEEAVEPEEEEETEEKQPAAETVAQDTTEETEE